MNRKVSQSPGAPKVWQIPASLSWSAPSNPHEVMLVRRGPNTLNPEPYERIAGHFVQVEPNSVHPSMHDYCTTYFAIRVQPLDARSPSGSAKSPMRLYADGAWGLDLPRAMIERHQDFEVGLREFWRDCCQRSASPRALQGAFERYGSPLFAFGKTLSTFQYAQDAFRKPDDECVPREVGLLRDEEGLTPILVFEPLDLWFQVLAVSRTMNFFSRVASASLRRPSPTECLRAEVEHDGKIQYAVSFQSEWTGRDWRTGVSEDGGNDADNLVWRTPLVTFRHTLRSRMETREARRQIMRAFSLALNRFLDPESKRFQSTWGACVQYRPGRKTLELELRPQNLFAAAIAGLLAEVIDDDGRWINCENCRVRFRPTNSKQRFCTTSCRVSTDQKKKRRSKEV